MIAVQRRFLNFVVERHRLLSETLLFEEIWCVLFHPFVFLEVFWAFSDRSLSSYRVQNVVIFFVTAAEFTVIAVAKPATFIFFLFRVEIRSGQQLNIVLRCLLFFKFWGQIVNGPNLFITVGSVLKALASQGWILNDSKCTFTQYTFICLNILCHDEWLVIDLHLSAPYFSKINTYWICHR